MNIGYRFGGIAALGLVAVCAHAVTDPNAAWTTPVDAALPSTTLSLELPAEQPPEAWAAEHNVSDYQVFRLAPDRNLVEVAMPASGWDQRRTELCTNGGAGCEPVQCQEVQLDAAWGKSSTSAGPVVNARLVRNTPNLTRILGGAEAAPGACEAPGDPYAEGVLAMTDDSGKGRIDDANLPADSDCWRLEIESACALTSTPLDSIVPAKEPARVLAVLDAANASQAAAIASAHSVSLLKAIPLRASSETLALLALAPNQDVDLVVADLGTDSRIAGAQPDFRYTTMTHADPLAGLTYGPEKTGAAKLHGKTTGKGALVAVIDTGADVQHPEIKERVKGSKDFTGEGYAAELHGTAIAGIIAAKPDNDVGGYGVAPGADLLLLKACQPLEEGKLAARCWTSTLVQALDEAFAKDARVINMSLSGPPDPLVAKYVGIAHEQNRLIVAAAGNGGPSAKPAFPAALPNVLAVTATDARDRSYREANEGDYIAVSAPGVDILSPAPGGTYPSLSGTSMASAHVAGAAALLLEVAPTTTVDALRATLTDNVRDLGDAGPDKRFGAGLVDLCAAAQKTSADAVRCEE